MKKFFAYALAALAIFAGGCFTGRRTAPERVVERPVERIDTITRTDTIRVAQPVFTRVRVTDTMYVQATDTVMMRDTAYIALPREEREYRGENYRAVVSGYEPRLDSLEQYLTERTVTVYRTEKPKPNYATLYGGVRYDGQAMMPVGVRIGRRWGPFEASAGGGYDFLTRSPVIDTELSLSFSWR